MTDMELLSLAHDAMQNAYAPYSGFKVGAAIECRDGSVFTGCNVENSAYPAALCAERAAVGAAVAAGNTDFISIAIVPSGGDTFCTPCGMCRQVLAEFSDEMQVLCARPDGRYVSYRMRELLPYGFKLKKNQD
ncbi:MAG: cytidine deaminase [Oscillospiraceae bacterium]|jgi:cytidine deaminase